MPYNSGIYSTKLTLLSHRHSSLCRSRRLLYYCKRVRVYFKIDILGFVKMLGTPVFFTCAGEQWCVGTGRSKESVVVVVVSSV